jgi:flagellin
MPVISTNTAANTALRYLNNNAADQSSALAKLASGSRITKASDDAAGLAIGTQLQSDVAVLSQASTNASQASSILQTADGGLSNISDILTRMKALATSAASGNVTDAQRTADIDTEFQQLVQEIDAISTGTRYSGDSLLDGTSAFASGVSFLVGTSGTDTITVTISAANSSALSLTGTAANLKTASSALAMITTLSTAIDTITQDRASVGALESRMNFHSQSISTTTENTSAAASTIMDADVAAQKSALSSADVKTQAAVAALTQANKIPQELLSLLQQ